MARPATSAATLNIDGGGHLRGASDVSVGGSLFDVEFLDLTCAKAFDKCDSLLNFSSQTLAMATLASEALNDQIASEAGGDMDFISFGDGPNPPVSSGNDPFGGGTVRAHWTPLAEPGTGILMGLGLVGLGSVRRRA